MDKNLFLAVALSAAVYAVWFGFLEKRVAPRAPERPVSSAPALPGAPGALPSAAAPASPEEAKKAVAEAAPISLGEVETRVNPAGAALASYLFREPMGAVELVDSPKPGLLATMPELAFKREKSSVGAAFSAKRPDGVRVLKEFLPAQTSGLPRLRVTLSNPSGKPVDGGSWTLSLGPGLGTIASEKDENHKVWRALGLRPAEKGLAGKLEELKGGEHHGPFRWVGVDNRYFLAAVLPKPEELSSVTSAHKPPEALLSFAAGILPARGSRVWEIPYYIGPKSHAELLRHGVGLERAINFGFFAQLGRIILGILNKLHSLTGNWGWSIILLTTMLQTLLFPLTYKSLKAMAAMRRLQPEISRLQQKYGKDQMRLNQEMMELYKKNGANPMGGCLPMVLQMPVFIALYNTLRGTWELHGAPWAFWIHDLSARDPYYVLPLVMGGLMWGQNQLNPASSDPTQKMMMNVMPVMFTLMFFKFPSGLVLYWLTNSLLSTCQQLALRDRLAAAPRPG